MTTPHTTVDDPAIQTEPSSGQRREPFWDVLRAAALARVVAWHTWTWTPLSWVAAMPAMFLVAGALLRDSVHRHGYRRTLTTRLRRLLLPFWVYGAVAVTTMLVIGWRPAAGDLIGWLVPLIDPGGSTDAPGLWIPLWYLRAYLWFVLLAGLLVWAARRWGGWLPIAMGALFILQRLVAVELPLAVADALAYGVFVTAGIVLAERGRLPSAGTALPVALAAGLAAIAMMGMDRASAVVNASHSMTVLVGVATVGLALALAEPIRSLERGRSGVIVDWMGRRALTIYLWHGMGLFAADRLVAQRGIDGPIGALSTGLVVVGVTAVMTMAFGWVEDVAARRPALTSRSLAIAVPAAAVVIAVPALLVVPPAEATATPPPSGLAVLAAADEIERELQHRSSTAPGDRPSPSPPPSRSPSVGSNDPDAIAARLARVLEEHAADSVAAFERHDIGYLELVAVPPGGPTIALRWEPDTGAAVVDELEPISWYSNTKSATALWLMTLVQDGAVGLDDPLAIYVPEVPHADRITLDQLARHRSGIPTEADSSFPEYERLSFPDPDGLDIGSDIRGWMASGWLGAEPGAAFQYSRIGYGLLAWALERATGMSWQEAMRRLGDGAGISLTIDEELAAPDTPNHHPGEGEYRGGAWAGGGLVSSPIDLVEFFHWAFTEHLDEVSIDAMTAAAPERTLGYFAVGLTIRCPCTEDADVLRGTWVGNGGANGWWQHDLATGATLMLVPERAITERGVIRQVHDPDFRAALFAALAG